MQVASLTAKQMVGSRIVSLAYGYQTHSSALEVALNSKVIEFLKDNPTLINDVGYIPRLNDFGWQYGKIRWLENKDFNSELSDDFSKVWISGAIIQAGDMLTNYNYFDRNPLLEMIRHMRNAVAHGNRFRIDSKDKLIKFPAHNRGARVSGWHAPTFYEITYELNEREFMGNYMLEGNILDVLLSAGLQLIESK